VTQFAIAGLVLGSVYAIAAVGLVISYQATGIMNFAFAGLAYFIARVYYDLNVQHQWPIPAAAVVSIVIVGPLLGVVLWATILRHLAGQSTLIQVVVTIGLSVTLPPLASLIFGNKPLLEQAGLAPEPVAVYHLGGVAVTLDQVIVLAATAVIVLAGGALMRFTGIGLSIRALVDSELMTSISGKNPQGISVVVWAASTFLAGLAGVLMAPVITLAPTPYATLIAGAFAAVIIARLRHTALAVVAALAIGVIGSLLQGELPPSSSYTAEILPAIPFALVLTFILAYSWGPSLVVRWQTHNLPRSEATPALDGDGDGDDQLTIDHLVPVGTASSGTTAPGADLGWRPAVVEEHAVAPRPPRARFDSWLLALVRAYPGSTFIVLVLMIIPFLVGHFWVALIAEGVAYGVAFLSYTLITGSAGFISLAQVSFAGMGAAMTGVFSTRLGIPVFLSILLAGLVVAPMGLITGLLTLRLGDLQVALVTLTLGLLMDNVVFTLNVFNNNGDGIAVGRPGWASTDRGFLYLTLAIFLLIGLVISSYRKSTGGMALGALRGSEIGTRSLGLSVVGIKVFMLSIGGFIVGIGGGLLAAALGNANPSTFSTLGGLIWVAILALNGISGILAALVAGLGFTVIPGLFQVYLPQSVAEIPSILFGFGAINMVHNPDGVVAQNRRQSRQLAAWLASLYTRRRVEGVPNLSAGGLAVAEPIGSVRAPIQMAGLAGGDDLLSATPGQTTPESNGGTRLVAAAKASKSPLGVGPGRRDTRAIVVEARDVTVRFGGLVALDGVSLSVPAGGLLGLIGPNGAGKTTLFGAMSGLITPNRGRVFLHGVDVTSRGLQERSRLGLSRTFQRPEVFPELTVSEHLTLAYRSRHCPKRVYTDFFGTGRHWEGATAERELVDSLLLILGLREFADREVRGLPLGAVRRVEVGRALATEPDVLLLDEPTSGLDDRETAELGDAIAKVRERRPLAMVLIEHDVDFVLSMCEAVTVLDFGQVISVGAPGAVREDPKVRSAYIGV